MSGKERRAQRRAARAIYRRTAKDLGLNRVELARRLDAKDEDAWAAVALAGEEHPEINIERLIELIMAIIEIFRQIFA